MASVHSYSFLVATHVCALTLRRCCRKGLGVQQVQRTLILLVFLLSSWGSLFGPATFFVV